MSRISGAGAGPDWNVGGPDPEPPAGATPELSTPEGAFGPDAHPSVDDVLKGIAEQEIDHGPGRGVVAEIAPSMPHCELISEMGPLPKIPMGELISEMGPTPPFPTGELISEMGPTPPFPMGELISEMGPRSDIELD